MVTSLVSESFVIKAAPSTFCLVNKEVTSSITLPSATPAAKSGRQSTMMHPSLQIFIVS